MTTIATVAVEGGWTKPREHDEEWHKVTRNVYSIDGYAPVCVTIRIGDDIATLHTVCLPGGSWWREPGSKRRRLLIDEALKGTGMRRVPGSRATNQSDTQWWYRYEIERAG